jgi:pyruvate kinase
MLNAGMACARVDLTVREIGEGERPGGGARARALPSWPQKKRRLPPPNHSHPSTHHPLQKNKQQKQYGPCAYHKQSLDNLAAAVAATGRDCAIIVDTRGREMSIARPATLNPDGWPVLSGEVKVSAGATITVVPAASGATFSESVFPLSYAGLAAAAKPGDQLFVGRYLVNGAEESSLYLEVSSVAGSDVVCTALNDATLSGMLTVIHSDSSSSGGMSSFQAGLPLFDDVDLPALREIGAAHPIDFLALTYTCSASDVAAARAALDEAGLASTKIIAKIENRQGLVAFAEVAQAADAVMLSRGNLGLDVPPSKVAAVQKAAVTTCNLLGKPVIITRLVDTMVSAPRCTRAEATDVANAVLDGVDGLMLGAETLRGASPAATVSTVQSIAHQAELAFDHAAHFDALMVAQMQAEVEAVEAAAAEADAAGGDAGGEDGTLAAAADGRAGLKKVSSFGSLPLGLAPGADIPARLHSGHTSGAAGHSGLAQPKVEAMASTAVRVAEKAGAALLIVFAYTGRTTSLVAKYRPAVPVLTVVVPHTRPGDEAVRAKAAPGAPRDAESAAAQLARQFLVMRGILPAHQMAAGPAEAMLAAAVAEAGKRGLAKVGDQVVAVMQHQGDLVLKIVAVEGAAGGADGGADGGRPGVTLSPAPVAASSADLPAMAMA